jgi:hypothetical protein
MFVTGKGVFREHPGKIAELAAGNRVVFAKTRTVPWAQGASQRDQIIGIAETAAKKAPSPASTPPILIAVSYRRIKPPAEFLDDCNHGDLNAWVTWRRKARKGNQQKRPHRGASIRKRRTKDPILDRSFPCRTMI